MTLIDGAARLPGVASVVPQLLLNRREEGRVDERRYGNCDLVLRRHIPGGPGTPWLPRAPTLGAQRWPQRFLRRLPKRGAPHRGGILQHAPHRAPIPDGLARAGQLARPREAATDLPNGQAIGWCPRFVDMGFRPEVRIHSDS